jgi:ABC-type transport system involved in multi-copper enzyme maturation permease subunit
MKNIIIMTLFTLREAMARKVFIFFLIFTAVVVIGTAVIFAVVDTEALIGSTNYPDDEIFLGEIVTSLQLAIIIPVSTLCLLFAIFSSSSFIPVMLEKGTIDIFLSKPISRNQLLTGKYLGGVSVVFINIAFLIIGVWLVISLRFSYWDASFLLIILTVTFTFAVLYSIIVLFGVITQGSLLGMMTTYFIYLILSRLLYFGKEKMDVLTDSDLLKSVITGLYYIIPKTSEIETIAVSLAAHRGIDDYQPIVSSFLFLVLTLACSLLLFKKKDF